MAERATDEAKRMIADATADYLRTRMQATQRIFKNKLPNKKASAN